MPITPSAETVWIYHPRTGVNSIRVSSIDEDTTRVDACEECFDMTSFDKLGCANLDIVQHEVGSNWYASHNPIKMMAFARSHAEMKQRSVTNELKRIAEA